ncbi:MAG: hypothetical protein U0T83_09825 [Bacteriovoracaceae bacterium]
MLTPLIKGQKFFRYPYLNEGSDPKLRDQMRVVKRSMDTAMEWYQLMMMNIFLLAT